MWLMFVFSATDINSSILSVMRHKYSIYEVPYFGMQYVVECFLTACTVYCVKNRLHSNSKTRTKLLSIKKGS